VLSNDAGTDRSQVALGQIPPSLHHAIFYGSRRAVRCVWSGRSIRPIDPIQTLAFGPLDPEGYRDDANVELLRHRSQRLSTADRRYHVPTPLQLTFCLLKAFLRAKMFEDNLASTVRDVVAQNCSGGCGTCPVNRLRSVIRHLRPPFRNTTCNCNTRSSNLIEGFLQNSGEIEK
jgi:hypothetical protein